MRRNGSEKEKVSGNESEKVKVRGNESERVKVRGMKVRGDESEIGKK